MIVSEALGTSDWLADLLGPHFCWAPISGTLTLRLSQAAGLVMPRRSLSHLAAMLNPSLIICDGFQHSPLPHEIWLERSIPPR